MFAGIEVPTAKSFFAILVAAPGVGVGPIGNATEADMMVVVCGKTKSESHETANSQQNQQIF